jgi:N-acetylglucosamine-6-sulfatase
VFTSDNGMSWGEHRWTSKEVPYEESAAVPLVVRYDAVVSDPRTDGRHLLVNIDLAPTFAQIAGVSAPGIEGRSFLPLLGDPSAAWRDAFLMEHLGYEDQRLPTFCGVHTIRYVFVEYGTGEEELYDLRRDPLELRNRTASARYSDERRTLARRLLDLCSPPPPGFTPWS